MPNPGRLIRSTLRRLGFDVYQHMAGGRRVPVRLMSIPAVGPLGGGTFRGVPKSFEIDIEDCTSLAGFSYRTGGWNPHVATLQEYVADRSLRYEDSSLHRLLHTFVPRTLQEIFLEDRQEPMGPLFRLPPDRRLYRYVWTLSPRLVRKAGAAPRSERRGHHYFGPMPDDRGQAQFKRLLDTYRSIEKEGFLPEAYGHVTGYFVADDTSYRFVVGAGNHRLAALKVLGVSRIPVRLSRSHPAVVHREALDSWTVEQGGPFERQTADALFDKFLLEDGLAKARTLGLGVE